MSPRWGFKTFGFPACYKHVAPLGLKTGNSRPLYISRCWGERQALTFLYRFDNMFLIRTMQPKHDTHVAPLGLNDSLPHSLAFSFSVLSASPRCIPYVLRITDYFSLLFHLVFYADLRYT